MVPARLMTPALSNIRLVRELAVMSGCKERWDKGIDDLFAGGYEHSRSPGRRILPGLSRAANWSCFRGLRLGLSRHSGLVLYSIPL